MKFNLSLTSAKVALFVTKKRVLIEKLENFPKLKIPKILAKSKCSKDWCVSFLFFLFFSILLPYSYAWLSNVVEMCKSQLPPFPHATKNVYGV